MDHHATWNSAPVSTSIINVLYDAHTATEHIMLAANLNGIFLLPFAKHAASERIGSECVVLLLPADVQLLMTTRWLFASSTLRVLWNKSRVRVFLSPLVCTVSLSPFVSISLLLSARQYLLLSARQYLSSCLRVSTCLFKSARWSLSSSMFDRHHGGGVAAMLA